MAFAVLTYSPSYSAPKKAVDSVTHKGAAQIAASVSAPGYDPNQVDGILDAVVDDLWAKTDEYWHLGDYPRIVDLDRIIVEIDPTFMEPYSVGGWLMESMGDLKNAEKFYTLGAVCNPTHSYLYYNLVAFYFNTLKDYPKATSIAKEAVKLSDADINDWRMLAHCYEKTHNLDKALETWKFIKSKYPKAVAVDVNLNRVEQLIKAAAQPPVKKDSSEKSNNPVLSL